MLILGLVLLLRTFGTTDFFLEIDSNLSKCSHGWLILIPCDYLILRKSKRLLRANSGEWHEPSTEEEYEEVNEAVRFLLDLDIFGIPQGEYRSFVWRGTLLEGGYKMSKTFCAVFCGTAK